MTSVNNSQISTNDNLITSSAIGLLSGAGFAMCGYNSKPYIKDGGISDEFVRNVEKKLAVKNSGGNLSAGTFGEFNNLIKQMGKADSCSQMADINFEYFRKLSPDKSFEGIKELIKQSFIVDIQVYTANSKKQRMRDTMLEYLWAIIKAGSINDLKKSTIAYYKKLMPYFDNFEQMRNTIKLGLEENTNLLLGLNTGESVKDMAESLFDVKKQRFMPDKTGNISNDFFKVIEKTAKNMQWKTAGIWGSVAAALVGGSMFLIQKISSSARSRASNVQAASRPLAALKEENLNTNPPLTKPQTTQFSELSKLIKEQNRSKA